MLTIIGVIVGFVMGLTGAGGALVAIPLFMEFLDMTLKEASLYSLVAVVMASLSNFYYQRKFANISLAAILITASGMGSYFSGPYKHLLPDLGIALTLASIAFYSLYSVWVPKNTLPTTIKIKINVFKTIIIGILLGILTTFTGLGGGVLILPILMGMYHLEQKQAVATSLVVVGLSSLISFIIQSSKGINLKMDSQFLGLIIGIFITSYLLKIIINKLPHKASDLMRKIVFTIVVGLSLAKIF